ncbi:hypothetical protein [Streptomyces sp. NPDC059491]|uniref:hypothetical protein n=1 Tax=Streptomyces sp. NPDC059491 TaxID=3346850 RepID=UPI0036C37118
MVALKAEETEGLLTLHTLHWGEELRDPHPEARDLPGKLNATAAEVKMAMQLIDALAMEGEPKDLHDSFREKVEALHEPSVGPLDRHRFGIGANHQVPGLRAVISMSMPRVATCSTRCRR